MQVTTLEILGADGGKSPLLPLTRATRDALARYCTLRFFESRSVRKAVEREWNLSPDEARAVMEAKASASTIDKIWKHPRGGWVVLLPVMGAVIGHGLDDFIEQERTRLAHERQQYEARERRLGEMARDLFPRRGLGDRRGAEPDLRPDREDRTFGG